MKEKKPKVVFTFVEAGMGHIIPMRVLSSVFKSKYGDKCEVINSYIFSGSKNPAVQDIGKELISHSVRASTNWLYNRFEAFSYLLSSKLTLRFLDINFSSRIKPFIEDLKVLNPDLIVSSYYLPSHLARKANQQGVTDTLIATYSPDPYIYPAWDRNCDLFMVNNDNAYKMAVKKGFNKEKVLQVPFMYKEDFATLNLDKSFSRKNLGLSEKFTVLITGGAYGANGTEKLVKTLLESGLNISVIVVCGKNQQLQESLLSLNSVKSDCVDYQVIGYTERLAEYMSASDIVVGKAGSNTIMETAFIGRPLIVFSEINRLEEITSKYWQKQNIIIRQGKPKKILEIIKGYIDNPQKLADYFCSTERFRNLTGAEMAADKLYELLKTKYQDL